MKEPLLEPLLRRARMTKVLPLIMKYNKCELLDIGCGFNYSLLRMLEPYLLKGYGIDFKVPEIHTEKICTCPATIDETLPFASSQFDVVSMLAVLEHLDKPLHIIREIERVLKPGGRLVLTVPSKLAKPILEFLSHRINIVNKEEVMDHKTYYNHGDLATLFGQTGLIVEKHKYFQFGMNNMLCAKKE
ncbi:class I SAM-dependent methyltransferase [Candidatus Magnetominusculus dajiuhuensis]|uniref:class I SAM-dependent methyltransferase n=1 Tax=Candidatus Magnetominusculus dajiuhuensis TaxID=3137712 RepID=UPI003B427C41